MAAELSSTRTSTMAALANRIVSLRPAHWVRVAVDGRTASGKTTFADELANAISDAGRTVIRASADGFHRAATVRHRQGRLSPDGYYEDARDLDALRNLLLEPLGPDGDGCYVTQTFDLRRDLPIEPEIQRAGENAVLIVDGTFLQRPELRSAWDFVIFLDVPEDEARRRWINRDRIAFGGQAGASDLYSNRYGPAFSRYELECNPADQADVIIDNVVYGSAALISSR